jgi:hypothetical protein
VQARDGQHVVAVVEAVASALQRSLRGFVEAARQGNLHVAHARQVQIQALAIGVGQLGAGEQARQLRAHQIVDAALPERAPRGHVRGALRGAAGQALIGVKRIGDRAAPIAGATVRDAGPAEPAAGLARIQEHRLVAPRIELAPDAVVE